MCSFVRAVLYDPEMRLNGGSVITYEPVPTADTEHGLLTAVYTLYSNGCLPGALQDIYAEQVGHDFDAYSMSQRSLLWYTMPAQAVVTS